MTYASLTIETMWYIIDLRLHVAQMVMSQVCSSATGDKSICCKARDNLLIAQSNKVAELENELITLVAEGDEYHASMVRNAIIAAKCAARLIHKHP